MLLLKGLCLAQVGYLSQLKAAVSAPFLKLPHRISATADLTKHVTASGIRSDLAASFMNCSVVGENDSLLRWNMVFNKDCRIGNQGIRSWPGSATDLLWDLGASHFTSLDLSLFAKKKKKMGLYQCQGQQAPEGNKMSGNQALDLALHDSGGSPSPPGLPALCRGHSQWGGHSQEEAV